jgi:hypothetical protein
VRAGERTTRLRASGLAGKEPEGWEEESNGT